MKISKFEPVVKNWYERASAFKKINLNTTALYFYFVITNTNTDHHSIIKETEDVVLDLEFIIHLDLLMNTLKISSTKVLYTHLNDLSEIGAITIIDMKKFQDFTIKLNSSFYLNSNLVN